MRASTIAHATVVRVLACAHGHLPPFADATGVGRARGILTRIVPRCWQASGRSDLRTRRHRHRPRHRRRMTDNH
jgi:hypothetical protein